MDTNANKTNRKTADKPVFPIVGCLLMSLSVGILYIWSVFRADVVHSLEFSDKAAAMVAPVMLFGFVIGGFVGGILLDRIGPRKTGGIGVLIFVIGVAVTGFLGVGSAYLIFFTYCILGGTGCGFAYMASLNCVQKWLPHKRGLATGLAVGSFGFSTVLFTPIVQLLIDAFRTDSFVAFDKVFFLLAGICAVLGFVGVFLSALPSEKYTSSLPSPSIVSNNTQAYKQFTPKETIKTPSFWGMFFYIFCFVATWNLLVPLIKGLGMERGLSEGMAVFTLSFTGVTNTAGRVVLAALSDRIGRISTLNIAAAMTLAGALCMTVASGWVYFLIVAWVAFSYGGPSSALAALATDLFGTKYAGTNYGMMLFGLGGGGIVFNLISTYILKGDVVPTFIMAGITGALAVLLMTLVGVRRNKIEALRAQGLLGV